MRKLTLTLFLYLYAIAPAHSSSEKIIFEDERVKLCLTAKPDEEILESFSDGIYQASRATDVPEFEIMHLLDTRSNSLVYGMTLGSVFYMEGCQGDDLSFLKEAGPTLKQMGVTRLFVDPPLESPYCTVFMNIGFKAMEAATIKPHHPLAYLYYDFLEQEGDAPEYLSIVKFNNDSEDDDEEHSEDQQENSENEDERVSFEIKMKTLDRHAILIRDKSDSDKFVGGGYLKLKEQGKDQPPIAVLRYLWIEDDPAFRGKGYAKKTMTFLEQQARQAGCAWIELETEEFLSWGFYITLGYEIRVQIDDYYLIGGKPSKSFVLEKRL